MSRTTIEYPIPIPNCYVWMTAGYKNRDVMFRRYVAGYIRANFPKLTLVRIEKMTAICERRDINGQKTNLKTKKGGQKYNAKLKTGGVAPQEKLW